MFLLLLLLSFCSCSSFPENTPESHYYYVDLNCLTAKPTVVWNRNPTFTSKYVPSNCKPTDDLCSNFCNPKGAKYLRLIHSMSIFIKDNSVLSTEKPLWEKDLGSGCKGIVFPARVAVFSPSCFPTGKTMKFCWKYETAENLAASVLAQGSDIANCYDYFHFAFDLPESSKRYSKPSVFNLYNTWDWIMVFSLIAIHGVGFLALSIRLSQVSKALTVIRFKGSSSKSTATMYVNGYTVQAPVEDNIQAGKWTWEPLGSTTGKLTVTTSCSGFVSGAVDYIYYMQPELSFPILKASSGQLIFKGKRLPYPLDLNDMEMDAVTAQTPLIN